jgi:hypothetical protein
MPTTAVGALVHAQLVREPASVERAPVTIERDVGEPLDELCIAQIGRRQLLGVSHAPP